MFESVEQKMKNHLMRHYKDAPYNENTIKNIKADITGILVQFDLINGTNVKKYYKDIHIESDPEARSLEISFGPEFLDLILDRLRAAEGK